MNKDFYFVWASDRELNELVTGQLTGNYVPWPSIQLRNKGDGQIGVLIELGLDEHEHIKPVVLVVPEPAQRRLFGRFASLREELAPLSTWCHIISEQLFDSIDDLHQPASLGGLEAAWSGLAIAESALLAQRPIDKIRVAACFATASFAVARTHALWPRVRVEQTIEKYELANSVARNVPRATVKLAKDLEPIWGSLIGVPNAYAASDRSLSKAILGLLESRLNDPSSENLVLAENLSRWPERELIVQLNELHPEARVNAFDQVINELRFSNLGTERSNVLAFVAGYIATIAAGGAPSIGLAEHVSRDFPAVLAWAYVIGGIGEQITWTSSFSGLGRLVSRELLRPLHLNEPPSCDFSIDEAVHLVDKQLSDPLVHLKIKQQRQLSIALFPGVNLTVPLSEQNEVSSGQQTTAMRPEQKVGDFAALVNVLWPSILDKIRSEGLISNTAPKNASSKKRANQTKYSSD
ncbi:hypothetical protein [Phyllobacterium sp. SB3]|uniref:hypothetical protein n=1 Tax=Phyllobacterium sp. SB3 TaxID=3156073 RepID=UPI0032AEB0CD